MVSYECTQCLGIYYMLMSAWGAIMLALMAICFKIRSPNLYEDVPFNGGEWAASNYSKSFIEDAYDKSAVGCGIASILYVILFALSVFAIRRNSARRPQSL